MSNKEYPADSFQLLGVRISVITLSETFDAIRHWSHDDLGRFICVREFPGLTQAVENRKFSALHQQASLVLPDGMPIVWLGRLKGKKVNRCCGPDLLPMVFDQGRDSNLKHYLYGGKEGVADLLADQMKKKFPMANVVGTECPPFRALSQLEKKDTLNRIRESGADIVWVGISSPKQDFWMQEHFKHLPCTMIGVGAAFDFHSGQVNRAPIWMQRTGFEWLFRLYSEPKRLWRRYTFTIPKFLWYLFLKCFDNNDIRSE